MKTAMKILGGIMLALISLAINTIWLSIVIMGIAAILIGDGFNTISKKYFKQ